MSSAAQRVLEMQDIMIHVLRRPGQARTIANLQVVSKRICASTRAVALILYSPRTLLKKFFHVNALSCIYDLLAYHGAIFTGPAVLRYLAGLRDQKVGILLVPHASLSPTVAALLDHGHVLLYDVPHDDIYDAGHDSSEELQYAPYVRQLCFCFQNRIVWVCVPRYNVLYGVLHQRTTLYMNGLSSGGFFSLYPCASFIKKFGMITHGLIPSRLPRYDVLPPFDDFELPQYGTWVQEYSTPHRPFRSGPRSFGDGMCWLLPNPFLAELTSFPPFTTLRSNSWSLTSRSFRGQIGHPLRYQTQKMICTRIITSPLLAEAYLATAVRKAIISGILARLEAVVGPTERLDSQMPVLNRLVASGSPYYFSGSGGVLSLAL